MQTADKHRFYTGRQMWHGWRYALRYVHLFHTLYAGLLDNVYFQQSSYGMEVCSRHQSAGQSIITQLGAEGWLYSVRASRHLWPLQMSYTGTLSKCLQNTAWPKSANGSGHGTYGRHLTLTGQLLRSASSQEDPLEGTGIQCIVWQSSSGLRQVATGCLPRTWGFTGATTLGTDQSPLPVLTALDMTEFYKCFEEKDKAI